MILTTKKPESNKERIQRWREKNFKNKQHQNEVMRQVYEKLGCLEPVER